MLKNTSSRLRKLSPLQRAFVDAMLWTDNVAEAKRRAEGNVRRAACTMGSWSRKEMREVLEEIGVTNEHLALQLRRLLEATETRYFVRRGRVIGIRVFPAWNVRLKTLKLLFELKGLLPKDKQARPEQSTSYVPAVPFYQVVPDGGNRVC